MRSVFVVVAALLVTVSWQLRRAAKVAADDGQRRVIVSLDEKPSQGRFVGIDSSWNFQFDTDDGKRDIAAKRLVSWGAYTDSSTGSHVLLSDGSIIIGEVLAVTDEKLTVASNAFGEVSITLERVSGIVFATPLNALKRDLLLDRVQRATGSQDRLLLINGDTVQGLVSPDANIASGRADDVLQKIRLRLPNTEEAIAIQIEKVRAITFDPAQRSAKIGTGLRCFVGLDDGSLLNVESVTADRDLQLHLVCGATLTTDQETLADTATWLQPIGGDCVYLSDTKPLDYKHIPFMERKWNYGVDRNVLQGRLRAGDALYIKGIGMHSTGRLAYSVPAGTTRLEAELALDAAAKNEGSVTFRVFTNAGKGWSESFKSPVVRGGDPPLPMSVDVTGTRGVLLVVDFADYGDILDHANWLNVRYAR